MPRSNFVIYTFFIEKVKTVDLSETNAACDLNVGRCRQLIKLMRVCEYLRLIHFSTLAQGHLHLKIRTFSETTAPF